MFKKSRYYRIESIEKNQESYGPNFWNAGYKYSYTPISCAMKYIAKIADPYMNAVLRSNQVDYVVVRSENEQLIYIKVTGRNKTIDKFINEVFASDDQFLKRFSMQQVPKCYAY